MTFSFRNQWFVRFAMLAVLASSRLALAQIVTTVTETDAADSQTDKSPAFSVHKEQKPVIEAFEDFERYRDKKAWEKAFSALAKIEDGKPGRLVPDKAGFLVPTDLKVRAELLSLPPEGREAYRLFNDAKAAQLLKDAADSNEVTALRKIVNRYFVTSIGDQAADRLGDALFESGDFPNADRCWRMIVENFPDSSLSPVLLQTKRAIALSRAGDWDQFEIVRSLLHDRYAGQHAHIGGADVVAADMVDGLRSTASPVTVHSVDQLPSTFVQQIPSSSASLFPATDQPIWQIPIMDSQATAQLTAQLARSGWGNMAGQFTQTVPATAVDEKRIYINWLGICFAADINSGKLLWRTDTFGDMTQKIAQATMQGIVLDPQIYSIIKADDNLLCTRRSTDNQNYNELAMTRMLCLSADKGKAIWKSESGALSGWGFVGKPLLDGDHFFIVAHPQNSQELSLLCMSLAKGEIRWQTGLGTPAASVNYRGMPTIPQPTLLLRSGKLMLLTNNGALLQIDLGTHQVDWAFGFSTVVAQQQYYYGNYVESPAIAPGTLLLAGPILYFKECNSNQMFAMDASDPVVKWKRRIDPEMGIASFDGRNLLLAGTEIECVDNAAQVLQWDDKTTIKTGSVQPMICGDWMYLFGSRGVQSFNLRTGDIGPTFRGYDHDSDGGVLWENIHPAGYRILPGCHRLSSFRRTFQLNMKRCPTMTNAFIENEFDIASLVNPLNLAAKTRSEGRCEENKSEFLLRVFLRAFASSRCILLSLVFVLLLTHKAMAGDDGISVAGTATVKGHPSEVIIDGTISGEGELANDASVKYHDSKKKATAAIDNLKNPDLSLKAEGSQVHEAVDPQQQQRIMQGMGGGETPKVRVQISERLELTLKNVDKMEPDKLLDTVLKLIDTSRDAGIAIGPPPATNYYQMQIEAQNGGAGSLVQFKIPDITELQADAYKQAIADARAKAQRIADLSGVKLGKVVSVHDEDSGANQQQTWNPWMGMMTGNDKESEKEATSTTFGEIPITVHLKVQFEIVQP